MGHNPAPLGYTSQNSSEMLGFMVRYGEIGVDPWPYHQKGAQYERIDQVIWEAEDVTKAWSGVLLINRKIWVCLKIVYPYTQWLMIIIPIKSPFGFPLRFEGAWVPHKTEKTSCFIEKNGVGSPVIVDK